MIVLGIESSCDETAAALIQDGSKILSGFLPPEFYAVFKKIEPFGFIILLILFYLGIISKLISIL